MPQFITPPVPGSVPSIGLGGRHIEPDQDGRFDVRGLDPQAYAVLMTQGWINADTKDDPAPPAYGSAPTGGAPAARVSKNPTVVLLNELDALPDEKLREMLDLRGVNVPVEFDHDKLVEIAMGQIMNERRKQAQDAEDAANSLNGSLGTTGKGDAVDGPAAALAELNKSPERDSAGATHSEGVTGATGTSGADEKPQSVGEPVAPPSTGGKTAKAKAGSTFTQENAPKKEG